MQLYSVKDNSKPKLRRLFALSMVNEDWVNVNGNLTTLPIACPVSLSRCLCGK